jgi:hypothetical protein
VLRKGWKASADSSKREEILLRQRIKQYQNENLPQIVDVDSIRNMPIGDKTPSTLDLMFQRISEGSENSGISKSQSIGIISKHFHYLKPRSHYGDDTLLYEPDSERIEKLKNSLKKQYPSYCELLQKIDESFYSK